AHGPGAARDRDRRGPAALGVVLHEDEVELLVLAAQAADEKAQEVGVDDAPDGVVPLEEPAEARLRHEGQPGRADGARRGRARLVVERAVLAEAPAGPWAVQVHEARPPDSAGAPLGQEDLDLALEDDVHAVPDSAFIED